MIRLLFFAQLAERAGADEMSVPHRPTPGALVASRVDLSFVKPAGARVAVNRAWSHWDAPLADGDEVAFLPPNTAL
ncbi:MAG: MoaD/ThiS family protein [Elusimicrobia bacterium]|nr:MoaD/ThiS family protein [Elusimicrobiota bacterium]MBK7208369.1 MoaD/ThiS family protein [Elusimicrobiota bacterium]MBK7545129.1 MoaD/ThiS family protein [Elusimicrobiota bacterium]MBK7574650.1 MoaD/ThiS family protein [Elusimicrobiota bacterium]MBK7688777.1 MoaD/ThiS family protein [Elusimicrobiota bacterium]